MECCCNTIEIKAPIKKVWATVSDFHNLHWAPEVVTSVAKLGSKGRHEIGAKRVVNDLFHETLTDFNSAEHRFCYSIDHGPGPLAKPLLQSYNATVTLTANDHGTTVEWLSSFQSTSDEDVIAFCKPLHIALLSALKNSIEKTQLPAL
jgi:carbon monoxide dehydrogenase subunit G